MKWTILLALMMLLYIPSAVAPAADPTNKLSPVAAGGFTTTNTMAVYQDPPASPANRDCTNSCSWCYEGCTLNFDNGFYHYQSDNSEVDGDLDSKVTIVSQFSSHDSDCTTVGEDAPDFNHPGHGTNMASISRDAFDGGGATGLYGETMTLWVTPPANQTHAANICLVVRMYTGTLETAVLSTLAVEVGLTAGVMNELSWDLPNEQVLLVGILVLYQSPSYQEWEDLVLSINEWSIDGNPPGLLPDLPNVLPPSPLWEFAGPGAVFGAAAIAVAAAMAPFFNGGNAGQRPPRAR